MKNLLTTLILFSFGCAQQDSVEDMNAEDLDLDLCEQQADGIQGSFDSLDVQAQEFDEGCLVFLSYEPGEEDLIFCRSDLTQDQFFEEITRFQDLEKMSFCEELEPPQLSDLNDDVSKAPIPKFDPAVHRAGARVSKVKTATRPKPKSLSRASNRFKVDVSGVKASPRNTLQKRIISAGKARLQNKANAQGVALQSSEVVNLRCSKGPNSTCSATVQSKVVR
ncbi:MAG: hypothetical protein CMK59_06565 [Proteobacteria bacterium]|nr:hypothetical protein [Pseudomonadota bacterium]